MKVTILGCGPSGGVPGIGGFWGGCDPNNPKNRRLRSSIFIENNGLSLLVDTSPDVRQQLLSAEIKRLDAVLYTHAHADHLHGIDDLRSVNRMQNAALDIYLDQDALTDIQSRFGYVLEPLADGATMFYKPVLNPHVIQGGVPFEVQGQTIMPIKQDHGFGDTVGYRIGGFAYSTDVVDMSDESFDLLRGVKVWVIGTLVDFPHMTHAHVEKALNWIEQIQPDRAYLTHLGAQLDYDVLRASLPAHVQPCHDGLEIAI